jgi:5-hydroxyisourate hydrolase-like protein (transthyretin family)
MKKFSINFVKFIFKYTVLLLGLFWVASQIFSTLLPIYQAVELFEAITGMNTDNLFADGPPDSTAGQIVDNFFTTIFFQVFLGTSTLAAIIGTLVLSKKRSLYEAVGMFVAFIIPRKRKNWGIVFNKNNRKPIAFANVRITQESGTDGQEFITETITDLDGRYRILLDEVKPDYDLTAKASGFLPFAMDLTRPLIGVSSIEVIEDIPMLKGFNRNLNIKDISEYFSSKLSFYLVWIFFILSYLYFFAAILYVITYPDSLWGYLNLALFIFAILWNTIIIIDRYKVTGGKILDSKSKKPLENVTIKVFSEHGQIITAMTNQKGVAKLDIPNGEYLVSLSKPGWKMQGNIIMGTGLTKVDIDENGYLKKNMFLSQIDEIVNQESNLDNSKLINPFK